MKINKTISMLLACLAGACLVSSRATAGTLIGSVIPLGFDTSGMTPDFFDLTAQGTLDWAKYGLDPDPAAFNQKSGVVNQISDEEPVGSTNTLYGGEVIGPAFSWSDGTPTPTGTGLQFSDYNCALDNGLQFTVAADTTTKYLLVYAGVWGGRLRCQAFLSDNSATGFTNNSVFTDVDDMFASAFQLQFAADSPGQTLTVQLIVDQEGVDGIFTSANLQAAALRAAPPPPEIVVPPVSQTNYPGYAAQFTATARGGLPLSYHWSKEVNEVYVPLTDGGQISGSGTPTLTISNLVFTNATNYYVVVTNNWGAVTSSVATLTVLSLTGGLIGAPLPAPAMVDLTAGGSLDWAAWGLNTDTDFDQKAGGTNQISNITLIGPSPNGPHRYNNALAAYSWSDGTPDQTATDTTTGVYFNGLNNGYQLTVPAGQTKRILRVYAGGWTTIVRFEAAMSDNSAPVYVDESLNGGAGNSVMAAYRLEYVAGSPGQTLTINVTCATAGGNVTLMAATLAGPEPLLLTQPASSTNWVGQNQQFSVAADGVAPLSYQWSQASGGVYVPLADGGQISGSKTATLNINNLVFTNATNYRVVVTNASGSVTSSVVNLTVLPITGAMQGGVDTNIASLTVVDLTAEGTLDWANWGLNDLLDFNEKAVGGVPVGLISNWTVYGPLGYGPTLDNFSDQPYGFSWTDGAPTASASTTGFDTANYVYVGGPGAGFQITVPADKTAKVLKLHYGGWACRTRVMAALSDNSAPTFINDSVDDPAGNIAYGVATIYFAAASAGQTLTITVYNVADYQGGNVAISAATLAGPAPIPLTYSRSGSSLQLTWPYGTLLQATNVTGPWTVNGNASPYTVTPNAPQMFYRVQVQ